MKQEIQQLEDMLRENLDSPAFARLASFYIEKGEYLHAIALCNRGTETFPEYATGFFLRAVALQRMEKYEESIEDYRKVREILPRCSVATERIQELEKKLHIETSPVPEEISGQETDTLTENESENETIEKLAEKLDGYKAPRSDDSIMHEGQTESVDPDREDDSELLIVSETLATIFFKQKQYKKAIDAYSRLMNRYPDKREYYSAKINEAEEAIKIEQERV
jgi:tetratricopeptide (TPR) repeat protein